MEETTTQILITQNAIIRIHRPVLTEEERAKRMKAIEQAAVNLALANRRAEALKQHREKTTINQ